MSLELAVIINIQKEVKCLIFFLNGHSTMQSKILLGVDAGGTFTDFVCLEFEKAVSIRTLKILSSPDAPEEAILEGIRSLGLDPKLKTGDVEIVHGSTVATNAALENKLAKTVFVTNRGFKDLLTLGRQTRPALYELEFQPILPPVPRDLCLETGGRLGADGSVVESLTDIDIENLIDEIAKIDPESVAINLLFSFIDPKFEMKLEQALSKRLPRLSISRSSSVFPVYKEFERGVVTWLNAALGPVIYRYLAGLGEKLGRAKLQVMQSSGETLSGDMAAERAVNLLLSGPAGGLKAVQFLGKEVGEEKLISFDMGGTSTDVALIDKNIETTTEGRIGPYPIGVPMLDMHTIGAGGGSIAFIDEGGLLRVGPQSSGAEPGPACYGKGGLEATVTDAHLVLGRLSDKSDLAGGLKLDKNLANRQISKLSTRLGLTIAEAANGIIQIANEHMIKAIRLISVNRGYDPKDFVLFSFGGAGGLHVCEIAEGMQMEKAIVPAYGGVLSALGMLVADRGRQFVRTVNVLADNSSNTVIDAHLAELVKEGRRALISEGVEEELLKHDYSVDCRYCGQSYTINVPWSGLDECSDSFADLHCVRYGYSLGELIEIVNLRVTVYAQASEFKLPNAPRNSGLSNFEEGAMGESGKGTKIYHRSELEVGAQVVGPAIITEYASTTYVAPSWRASADDKGNLQLIFEKAD